MENKKDEIQHEYKINAKEGLNTLSKLQIEYDELTKYIDKNIQKLQKQEIILAKTPTSNRRYEGLKKGIAELNTVLDKSILKQAQVSKSIAEMTKETDLTTLSKKQLNRQLSYLKDQYDRLNPAEKDYIEQQNRLQKQAAAVNKELTARGPLLEKQTSFLQDLKGGLPAALIGGVAGGAVGVAGDLLSGIVNSVSQKVEQLAKKSDSLSDLQVAFQTTAEDAKAINTELSKIDTRTVVDELRQIATEGGLLNVPREELQDFVQEVDKVVVVMQKDFPGGIDETTNKLGKLKALYAETKDLKFGDAVRKDASAIKKLADDGTATAGSMTQFALIIGQLPDSLRPTLTQTLGLGAAFEEAGFNAETAASNVAKTLLVSAKNVDKVAAFFGKTKKEIKELINTKPNEFLLQLAQRLSKLKGTDLASTLDSLKLSDTQVVEILGVLGGQIDNVTKKQELANKAFQEGTRINEVFDVKNNNLAANLIKLGKAVNFTFNLDNSIAGISEFVKWLIQAVKDGKPFVELVTGIIGRLYQLGKSIFTLADNVGLLGIMGKTLKLLFTGIAIGITAPIVGFQALVIAVKTAVDSFSFLINKGKEVANFFGAKFKIDPNLSFSNLVKNFKKDVSDLKSDVAKVFGVNEKGEVKKPKTTPGNTTNTGTTPKDDFNPIDEKAADKANDLAKQRKENAAKIAEEIYRLNIEAIDDESNRKKATLEADLYFETQERQKQVAEKKMEQKDLDEWYNAQEKNLQAKIAKIDKDAAEKKAKEEKEIAEKIASTILETKLQLAEASGDDEQILFAKIAIIKQKFDVEVEKATADMKQAIYERYLADIEALNAAHRRKEEEKEKAYGQKIFDILKKNAEKKKSAEDKLENEKREAYKKLAQAGEDAILSLLNSRLEKQNMALDRQNDREQKALERNRDKGLITEEDYALQKSEIDRQYQRKVAEFKRKQAIYDKAQAMVDVAIATAISVAKAKGNPILIGLAIAAGVAQEIAIAAKPLPEIPSFFDGKIGNETSVFDRRLPANDGRGGYHAILHPNEDVIPAKVTRNPYYYANVRPIIEAMRADRMPNFERSSSTQSPSFTNPSATANTTTVVVQMPAEIMNWFVKAQSTLEKGINLSYQDRATFMDELEKTKQIHQKSLINKTPNSL